ncbi:MAG: histidine phosphatase family protein [Marinifilaceae bacterium]|jgi:phosphohistidine phosphatase
MKRLIVVRHAKAELLRYDITDFQRNLKKRGINDSDLISEKLKEKEIHPDLIISSKAHRALQTANHFADSLDYPREAIDQQDFLYDGFTTHDFLDHLQSKEDSIQTVMVFGHNPSIEYLAFNLLDKFYGEVPTCTAIGIDFDVASWKDIEVRTGKLSLYEFPKKYK